MGFVDKLTDLVGSMEWYWTVLLGLLVFNMMAGILGLDGGHPKPKDQFSPEQLQDESNTRVFMDVDMDGERIGRIVMELFDKLAPKAVENFRCLCTGEKGMGTEGESEWQEQWKVPTNEASCVIGVVVDENYESAKPSRHSDIQSVRQTDQRHWYLRHDHGALSGPSQLTQTSFSLLLCLVVPGKLLHYKGCGFHRIIPKFMCQGGDITAGDGTGGESIYNGLIFENEFENGFMTHDREGLLSMANSGPNSNSSQFFITTGKCDWLDLRHVAFGVVVEGMDVVQKMNTVGSRSGKPSAKVVIADCGQLKKDTKKTQ